VGEWHAAAPHADLDALTASSLIKLIVVAISGVTAALHARARNPRWIAVFGALTGLSALAALFLGILLAG
jgi:hypothetical protein